MHLIEFVDFSLSFGDNEILKNVNFVIDDGEVLCLLGENGCGKTTLAKSIMGLCEQSKTTGEIYYQNSPIDRKNIVGKEITMIFQNHKAMLNPVMKIGYQIAEPLIVHKNMKKKQAKQIAISMMEKLGLSSSCYDLYPHQISLGMGQRVGIAMALITKPKLIIADEPTSSLDSDCSNEFLTYLKYIQKEYGISILLITHDKNVANKMGDRMLYLSKQQDIAIPNMADVLLGDNIVEIKNGCKKFGDYIVFSNLNLCIKQGENVGIVGKSGIGKTTLAKVLIGIEELSGGEICYYGRVHKNDKDFLKLRRKWHYIMQDSYTSLNPKQRIDNIITEGIIEEKTKKQQIAKKMIKQVGLSLEILKKYPNELSGGQKSLVSMARCFAMSPDFIIFDETFVAMDSLIKARIFELIIEYKKTTNATYIFISHDEELLHKFCQRCIIL